MERSAGFFYNEPVSFLDLWGIGPRLSRALATFAEFICSIFIIAGLMLRYAVIPPAFTMLIVIFIAKKGDPFSEMELPVFIFPFIYFYFFQARAGIQLIT